MMRKINDQQKADLIKAIATGQNIEKIEGIVNEKKGNVIVIRSFLDGLKVTSQPIPDDVEIKLDETSDFGKFLLELNEREKRELAGL